MVSDAKLRKVLFAVFCVVQCYVITGVATLKQDMKDNRNLFVWYQSLNQTLHTELRILFSVYMSAMSST